QHPGFPEADQDRAFRMVGEAAHDADLAQLVGRAAAGAGNAHAGISGKVGRARLPLAILASASATTGRTMSIRSMTAYASGERSTPWGTIGCELRAVNHRFLELGTRLPDELRVLEPALRERVSGRVARGKVDLALRLRQAEN